MNIVVVMRLIELKDLLHWKDWDALVNKLDMYNEYETEGKGEALINALYEADIEGKQKLLQ
jgi:hypothetical protein